MSDDRLVELLAASFAQEIAMRVAAELDGASPPVVEGEPWHLLDLEEAAARLGRSPRWLRERVRCGAIPVVRLDGGALGFELEDLQAFARTRRVTGEVVKSDPRRLRGVGRDWLEEP